MVIPDVFCQGIFMSFCVGILLRFGENCLRIRIVWYGPPLASLLGTPRNQPQRQTKRPCQCSELEGDGHQVILTLQKVVERRPRYSPSRANLFPFEITLFERR